MVSTKITHMLQCKKNKNNGFVIFYKCIWCAKFQQPIPPNTLYILFFLPSVISIVPT